MSALRRAALAAALAGAMIAPALRAQAPAPSTSYTVEDILVSLHRAALEIRFDTVNANANRILDSLTALLRGAKATSLSIPQLVDIIEHNRAGLAAVARWDPQHYTLWTQPWFDSTITALRQIANTPLANAMPARLASGRVNELLAPIDALGNAIRAAAQANNQEKLRRYEVKYGPGSQRLNAVEVALNYVGQLWVPGLRPSTDGWPSPYELVASYRTTELTATQATNEKLSVRMVSATQIGLRRYNFGDSWGVGGPLKRLLKPADASAGLFLMGPSDEPLARTWGADTRAGAFFGWGTVHAGYVFGTRPRFVIGTGKQVLPYLF